MKDAFPLIDALAHPNVQAFAMVVRVGEGTDGPDGYRTMFGGDLFTSFDDHPRLLHCAKLRKGGEICSTAAGAYQFLERTWDWIAKDYGLLDFTPKSQDIAFAALVAQRKALADVIAGRFEDAVRKCNLEWASLPESPYGQPTRTMADAGVTYLEHGGIVAA
jgi:muramidase (phage lysozyme)